MPYCSYCGSAVEAGARFCPSCGRQQHAAGASPAQPQPQSQIAPSRKSHKVLWVSVALVIGLSLIFFLMDSGSDESSSTAKRQSSGQQESAQSEQQAEDSETARERERNLEMYAVNLETMLKQDGYDVEVLASYHLHLLTLKSDSFQDAAMREGVAHQVYGLRKTLCGMGVWTAEVGYSRGMLSSDVMKTFSLGCPDAKAARIKATEADRQELANALNFDSRVKNHIEGTTLVCESPEFFDNAQLRAQFLQFIRSEKDKLCNREVSSVRLKGKNYSKTFPVGCN